MNISILTGLFLLLFCSTCWSSSIYKCKSADGSVFFQDSACETDHVTVSEKKVAQKLDKSKLSRMEKFYVDSYVLYKQSAASLKVCKGRKVSGADELDHRVKRFQQISHNNLVNGEKLFTKGTKDISPDVLKNYLNQKINGSTSKLRKMSQEGADGSCRYLANALAVAASQVPNRATGYQEGDLDPEGND